MPSALGLASEHLPSSWEIENFIYEDIKDNITIVGKKKPS